MTFSRTNGRQEAVSFRQTSQTHHPIKMLMNQLRRFLTISIIDLQGQRSSNDRGPRGGEVKEKRHLKSYIAISG